MIPTATLEGAAGKRLSIDSSNRLSKIILKEDPLTNSFLRPISIDMSISRHWRKKLLPLRRFLKKTRTLAFSQRQKIQFQAAVSGTATFVGDEHAALALSDGLNNETYAEQDVAQVTMR